MSRLVDDEERTLNRRFEWLQNYGDPKDHWTLKAPSEYGFHLPKPMLHLQIFLAAKTRKGLHLKSRGRYKFFPLCRYKLLAPTLRNSNSLDTLKLVNARISASAASSLGSALAVNQTIRILDLANCRFEPGAVAAFVVSGFLPRQLRRLKVVECFRPGDDQFIDVVRALQAYQGRGSLMSLEELDLRSNWCPSEGADALVAFLLTGNSADNVQAKFQSKICLNLGAVSEFSNRSFENHAEVIPRIFAGIQGNKTVKSLLFDGICFKDDDLEHLALALRHNSTISEVSLLPPPSLTRASSYGIRGLEALVAAVQSNVALERLRVEIAEPEIVCIAMVREQRMALQSYLLMNRCGRRFVCDGGNFSATP